MIEHWCNVRLKPSWPSMEFASAHRCAKTFAQTRLCCKVRARASKGDEFEVSDLYEEVERNRRLVGRYCHRALVMHCTA